MSPTPRGPLCVCLFAMIPAAFGQDAGSESLKRLAKDIVHDQKVVWTSPFHMTHQDAKWWGTVAAITGVLLAADRRESRQLPNTVDQVAFSRHVSQLGAVYTLIPIAAGAYLTGVLAHNDKLRKTGLLAGEALADGLIVGEVLKYATGRQRPLAGDGGGHFLHSGDSFPSGHTMGSFALASVIAHRYPDNKAVVIAVYGLATVVGASRFSARQHFGSDIVAGGAIGWFIGRHVVETHEEGRRPRAKDWLSPQIIPTIQPSDHSYGIALAWHR
jgi:membrane-associated phospholipid phosphatase